MDTITCLGGALLTRFNSKTKNSNYTIQQFNDYTTKFPSPGNTTLGLKVFDSSSDIVP